MTTPDDPTDPRHDDPTRPSTDGPATDGPIAYDPVVQESIRDLLRTELPDVDPAQRERTISAALAAAEEALPSSGPAVRPLSDRRRPTSTGHRASAMRPVLVAAALVVVVAGAAVASTQWSGSGEDTASGSMSATADGSDDASTGARDDSGAESGPGRDHADALAEAPASGFATAPVSLGSFENAEDLLDAAEQETTPLPSSVTSSTPPALEGDAGELASPCPGAPGRVIASATLRGQPVLVVRPTADAVVVIELSSCGELARR